MLYEDESVVSNYVSLIFAMLHSCAQIWGGLTKDLNLELPTRSYNTIRLDLQLAVVRQDEHVTVSEHRWVDG
jgi:hypothetical protein